METTINWNASKEETEVIRKIVKRASEKHPDIDFLSMQMDLTACHLNGNALILKDLLEADDFNFGHDVFGISRHIDRENGKLMNCFLPRFSAKA